MTHHNLKNRASTARRFKKRPAKAAGGMPRQPGPGEMSELTLRVGLEESADPAALRAHVAKRLRRPPDALPPIALRRRSIDARHGRVTLEYLLGLGVAAEAPLETPKQVQGSDRVVVVGDGPCGLFAAHRLACLGIPCTVIDRGKPVQPRRHDLKALQQGGAVDENSNYCFGEGGAGTYSDGKLYTRSHKRGPTRDVLRLLVQHGAPEAILIDARPHIGSNKLPRVVSSLRESLLAVGQVFRFGARVRDLVWDGGRVRGATLEDGTVVEGSSVVLATGHSARDVFAFLEQAGVALEAKPFALGVRIEHPQPFINRVQYGQHHAHPALPNAAYRVVTNIDNRGVFSFCMCPGGWIVPASTDADGLVVNGMSLSRRDSPYANSGLVVSVEVADWEAAGYFGPRGGIRLQTEIEAAAQQAGGGALRAPATRASDFIARRASATVPASSYLPGLNAGDVAAVLDAGGVAFSSKLRAALQLFEQRMPGYAAEDAVLVGVETRTSSPVRIVRDPRTLMARGAPGLYPAGEGAGYAGGIMSAALDGFRVADAIARSRAAG